MTENKRFYIEDNGIWDNTWKRRKPLTWKELCDTLNKFQELSIKDLELIEQLEKENEQLKQQLRIFGDGLKSEIKETKIAMEDWNECLTDCRKLKKENEQLKHDATVLIQSNTDYRKENEQLKEQLKNLRRLSNELYMEGSE